MDLDESWRATPLRRRTALTAGLVGTAALSLGLVGDTASTARPVRWVPAPGQPTVIVEQAHSRARNRDVNLVTMVPKHLPRQGLPVCLMLHGRFGDARRSVGGLPEELSRAVAHRKVPPFALFAVDGGANTYWHRTPGDDPMWMLLDEVPQWLIERGLGGTDGQPFAVAGISMGGFGALLYARRRRERGNPLKAAAVIAPALITNWNIMAKRRAFTSEAEWATIDPLRHVDVLADVPLGVWCGTSDRFIEGTRQFIRLAHPEVASTGPGGHNSRYYRKVLPEVVTFIGSRLAKDYGNSTIWHG